MATTAWVALLRGVNVGGRHKLAMVDLRRACEAVGGVEVSTYIQSGNAVFVHPSMAATELGQQLEKVLADKAGFEIPVMLRTAAQMKAVVEAVPFPEDPEKVHVAFLAAPPKAADVSSVAGTLAAPEDLAVVGADAYLYLPEGVGRAKLPMALVRLKVGSTMRNWRTVNRLAEMSAALVPSSA